MSDQRDIKNIGGYHTHKEPMQIVSGSVHNPVVHFETHPSARVKDEMKCFIAWFNDTGPKKENSLPALTRTGIAEKALSQALNQPTLIALSQEIEADKRNYYQALHDNSKDLTITDWLITFGNTIFAAQQRSQRFIEFLIEKTKLLNHLGDQLNERQEKVLVCLFREALNGFKGGLSAENYISITNTSRDRNA